MRLLSSATQHRVTLPLTGMCHTTTSMRKMQTHTCAYRKGGLSRAVHPTFGREIVQNPVKSQWQGKTRRGHSSHLAPSPDSCLSKPASATCGRSWLSQLISASGCTQQVVTPVSPPAASHHQSPESGLPCSGAGEQKQRNEHPLKCLESRRHDISTPGPNTALQEKLVFVRDTWIVMLMLLETSYWTSLIPFFCETKSNKNTNENIKVLYSILSSLQESVGALSCLSMLFAPF